MTIAHNQQDFTLGNIGIDYSPNNANVVGRFAGDMFSRMSGDSVESIKQCIKDIHELIESRRILNRKIIEDLDRAEVEISSYLNKTITVRVTQETREMMMLFKTKAIEIAEAKRKEELECWKDIAKLREELRVYNRELSEKQSRMSILDNILK